LRGENKDDDEQPHKNREDAQDEDNDPYRPRERKGWGGSVEAVFEIFAKELRDLFLVEGFPKLWEKAWHLFPVAPGKLIDHACRIQFKREGIPSFVVGPLKLVGGEIDRKKLVVAGVEQLERFLLIDKPVRMVAERIRVRARRVRSPRKHTGVPIIIQY